MADEYFDPEIETRPWPAVTEWQRDHLPGFLSRVATAVPFYGERLRGLDLARAGVPEVWARVPFTTKEDLRSAQEELDPERPLGRLQAVPADEVVQVLA